jgi:hypothetical protein
LSFKAEVGAVPFEAEVVSLSFKAEVGAVPFEAEVVSLSFKAEVGAVSFQAGGGAVSFRGIGLLASAAPLSRTGSAELVVPAGLAGVLAAHERDAGPVSGAGGASAVGTGLLAWTAAVGVSVVVPARAGMPVSIPSGPVLRNHRPDAGGAASVLARTASGPASAG